MHPYTHTYTCVCIHFPQAIMPGEHSEMSPRLTLAIARRERHLGTGLSVAKALQTHHYWQLCPDCAASYVQTPSPLWERSKFSCDQMMISRVCNINVFQKGFLQLFYYEVAVRLLGGAGSCLLVAPLHQCITVSVHHCITVLLHQCTAASLHHCVAALLHQCVAASLHWCVAVSLHRCIAASVCCCIGASLCCCVAASLRAGTSAALRFARHHAPFASPAWRPQALRKPHVSPSVRRKAPARRCRSHQGPALVAFVQPRVPKRRLFGEFPQHGSRRLRSTASRARAAPRAEAPHSPAELPLPCISP